MSGRNVFISGSGNKVEGAENFAAINCQDQEYTSEHSGKTIMNNGAMVVNEEEVSLSVPIIQTDSTETKSTSFLVEKSIKDYFVDCTSGNIDIELPNDGVEHTFTKIDGSANNVKFSPQTGNINGAADYSFNSQYERRSPLFDGTNWYV